MRRDERRVRAALEVAGVADRVRAAYLALRREDVQAQINAVFASTADWKEKPPMVDVARYALSERGYDLDDVEVTVKVLPGKMKIVDGELVNLPPRAVFMADASGEAVRAAMKAVGARHAPPQAAAAAVN